jgi:very-short-patch-repair endonuclease
MSSWGNVALKIAEQNPDVEIVEERKQPSTEARRELEKALRGRLSETFLAHWERNGLPALTPEYRFHSERKWRFDYALPEQRIAVEVEGGTWQNGRHNRAKGYAKDAEKYNEAQGLGWTVFRFSDVMIRDGQEAMDAYLKPIKERIGQ